MAGDLEWKAAEIVAVLGWLLSPVITLLLPKILACLGFDASQKLEELEICIIPELQKTMHAVDQARMMQRGKKPKSDVAKLDKMAAMLRHARDEAEDIFDDAQHNIVTADILYWRCRMIARIVQKGSARLLSSLRRFLGRPDVETLKADLNKISSELGRLLKLNKDNASGQLSGVDRVRMIPKTLRADMLKTTVELRRLRREDTGEEFHYLRIMDVWLRGAQQEKQDIDNVQAEDTADDSHFLDKMVALLRRAEEAEDIHDYWIRLYGAVQTCIARCNRS